MTGKYATLSVIVVVLLAGCAHRERAAAPTTSPTGAPTATTSVAAPSSAGPVQPGDHAPRVLADGRYPAFLTAVDVADRTVTFDIIQWFSGAAAEEAYHQDHPETESGPPNPFYIRNQSPRLRTLPVSRNVSVEIIWLIPGAGSEPTTFEALPAYFADDVVPDDKYIWYDPFWLTVRDDRVVSMTEQYLP